MESILKRVAVISHRRSDATREALLRVLEICRAKSVEVVLPDSEIEKYSLGSSLEGVETCGSLAGSDVEMCIALGGDGTILRAFNHFPGMQVPVFGVNYGRVGFLSAAERESLDESVTAVLADEIEIFELSLIELALREERFLAFNDVVVHKPDGGSIIRLAYAVAGVELATHSCDGMLAATPAGSTAYNLASGGPLLSLRIDAMVINAIAPHTLCWRPLIVAHGDEVRIRNESPSAIASIYIDGRSSGDLAPGSSVSIVLSPEKARLVQLRGVNFYRKLLDKFIRTPR